jgi:hypothetical protein
MRNLFDISKFKYKKELRKLVMENVAIGKPLEILDDIVFKAMQRGTSVLSDLGAGCSARTPKTRGRLSEVCSPRVLTEK